MKSPYIHIILIGLLTAIGFWLRFTHLDAINLYGDEYFQFETAAGYLTTGEFVRYNFYTEQIGEPYTRAKTYTWQIAQSMKVFGVNEIGARFPAVVWGTLLIPLLIGGLLLTTKQPWTAYAVGVLVAFDNFFLEMSRFTRMYSMLFVLTVLVVIGFYVATTSTVKRWLRWLGAGISGGGLILASTIYMELTMALVAAMGIYCVVRAVVWLWKREPRDKLFAWIVVLGVIVSIIGGVIHVLGWHFIPVDAFIIRANPHFFYLDVLFEELRVPQLGLLWVVLGILSIRSTRSMIATHGMIGGALLIYFIFLSNRWEAKRYVGFLIPFVYVMMSLGFVQAAKMLGQWLKLKSVPTICIGLGLFFLLGPWLSFPGIPAEYYVLQPAYADRTYDTIPRANVTKAYAYIMERYQPGEVMLMQGPRYYYWPDNTIPIMELGYRQELSLDAFKDMARQADRGGWIVYNQKRAKNISKALRKYIDTHAESHYREISTGVYIYHFNPGDFE